jgi:hypothetical protein
VSWKLSLRNNPSVISEFPILETQSSLSSGKGKESWEITLNPPLLLVARLKKSKK